MRTPFFVLIPILPVSILIGCGGGEEKTNPPPSTPHPPPPNTNPSRASLVAKMLLEVTGTSGTVESDYEESLKFLQSRKEVPELSKSSSSLLDKFTSSLNDAISSGREWSSGQKQADSNDQLFIQKIKRVNPPISFIRFLIFNRFIRNAAHIEDPKCQNEIVTDAITFFSLTGLVSLNYYLELCTVMSLDTDCPTFALKYTLAEMVIEHFIHSWGLDGKTVTVQNFLHTIPIQVAEYQNCPTDTLRQHYTTVHKKAYDVFSAAIEPPSKPMCIEDHIRNILDQWSTNVENDLHLLQCKIFKRKEKQSP